MGCGPFCFRERKFRIFHPLWVSSITPLSHCLCISFQCLCTLHPFSLSFHVPASLAMSLHLSYLSLPALVCDYLLVTLSPFCFYFSYFLRNACYCLLFTILFFILMSILLWPLLSPIFLLLLVFSSFSLPDLFQQLVCPALHQ